MSGRKRHTLPGGIPGMPGGRQIQKFWRYLDEKEITRVDFKTPSIEAKTKIITDSDIMAAANRYCQDIEMDCNNKCKLKNSGCYGKGISGEPNWDTYFLKKASVVKIRLNDYL